MILRDYEAQLDQVIQKKQEAGLEEDEDKEPTDSEIKKNKSLAKYAEDLALLTREMKSLARKYSKAEGIEKEMIRVGLKKKNIRKNIDCASAAWILQGVLDRLNNGIA